MPSDLFLMDEGEHHGRRYTTRLYRHHIVRRNWAKFVWRDAPPGSHSQSVTLQFDDIDGKPVDSFGLPLLGNFIEDE